jgi:hypothetical protein
MKQEIHKQQTAMTSDVKLQCVEDVVNFCRRKQAKQYKPYAIVWRPVQRFYHLIERGDMDRTSSLDCKKIKRVRSVHSISYVSASDIILLNSRFLACFCLPCMDDNQQFCEKRTHVHPWKLNIMEPLNILEVSGLGQCPNYTSA